MIIRKCTPTKYSPLNFSIFQGAYYTHLPRAPNFSIINYAFATRGRVHWLLFLPYFSNTTLEFTLIDCIWHKLITNAVRLCNHVTIVYHDKLEADRPIHSIAAFEALFLARLTTWIALVFCVVNLLYYLWRKRKRPVTLAHNDNLCCMSHRLLTAFQKNPRHGDPFRLSRNSHVRPWANCVDQ